MKKTTRIIKKQWQTPEVYVLDSNNSINAGPKASLKYHEGAHYTFESQKMVALYNPGGAHIGGTQTALDMYVS